MMETANRGLSSLCLWELVAKLSQHSTVAGSVASIIRCLLWNAGKSLGGHSLNYRDFPGHMHPGEARLILYEWGATFPFSISPYTLTSTGAMPDLLITLTFSRKILLKRTSLPCKRSHNYSFMLTSHVSLFFLLNCLIYCRSLEVDGSCSHLSLGLTQISFWELREVFSSLRLQEIHSNVMCFLR